MPTASNKENSSPLARELIAELVEAISKGPASLCEGLPDRDNGLMTAEGIRNLTRVISSAQLNCLECDPRYPYLVKTISVQRRIVLPSVDTVYHAAILHGDYSYRLSGNRGSAYIFELEVWRGHLADLFNFKYHSSLDIFSAGPGEEVNIRLSCQRGGGGDWLELPEGECTLLIRQYYYDWENEKPAFLAIEREGATYPPPPLAIDELKAQVRRMADYIRTYPVAARHGVNQHLSAEADKMHLAPVSIGFTKLRYMHGMYDCKPDEAIILEVKPPVAKYWNFQLMNLQWETLDYHMRQSAINGYQAKLNGDGVFRAVISHRDPGISNWLDTSGRDCGLISARYYAPDDLPIPTLKKVSFNALAQHLPSDMARVTPAQRQEAVRRLMLSTIRRLATD